MFYEKHCAKIISDMTQVVVAVGLELVIGLALALALQKQRWARDLTRSMLLAPMFITPIAVGLTFRFLLNDRTPEVIYAFLNLEPGEDPQPCAERELIEETGYRAAQVSRLLSFYSCPGFCTEMLHAFVAEQLSEAEQNLDETEHIEPKVMTLDEAYAMVRDNRIEDGKTVATLLYYRFFATQ